MLENILSDVSSSPAAVARLASHAKHVRKQARLYLIATIILASVLILQIVHITLFPLNATQSAHPNDMIHGGVSSVEDMLSAYDQRAGSFYDAASFFDITRQDIAASVETQLTPTSTDSYIGTIPIVGTHNDERHYVTDANTLIATPFTRLYSSHASLDSYTNTNASVPFSVLTSSGALVLHDQTMLPPSSGSALETTITAIDVSSGEPVSSPLHSGDRVLLQLEIKNTSPVALAHQTVTYPIRDILEYADVIEGGNGVLSPEDGTISWGGITLDSQETTSRSFTIRIDDAVSASPVGSSNPLSYDCIISLAGTNSVHLAVQCPLEKQFESLAITLPSIPLWLTPVITGALTLIAYMLYLRQHTVQSELRIIRHTINTGGLS